MHGHDNNAGDRRDVADEIEVELVIECRVKRVRRLDEEERIAIRGRTRDGLRGDITAGARTYESRESSRPLLFAPAMPPTSSSAPSVTTFASFLAWLRIILRVILLALLQTFTIRPALKRQLTRDVRALAKRIPLWVCLRHFRRRAVSNPNRDVLGLGTHATNHHQACRHPCRCRVGRSSLLAVR
jgi:hypothetical protein